MGFGLHLIFQRYIEENQVQQQLQRTTSAYTFHSEKLL